MRSLCLQAAAILIVGLFVLPTRSQLLPSQAKGAARAQVVMLSVNGGCAAGIVVGYDEKVVYVATAAHIAELSEKPLPAVTVQFEGFSKPPSTGKFLPQFEGRYHGDLAVVTVGRDDLVNKFLDNLDFALLSPVPLEPADTPVTSIGCSGGSWWSSGINETLLTLTPDQRYLRFHSDMGEGQSGGGLFNEAWELIGMPLDKGDNWIDARPIAQILEDLRKWGVPIRLAPRPLNYRARGADEIARERARESKARELAAFSTESLSDDPEKSILLGMQAVNATLRFGQPPVPAAEEALHRAIMLSRVRLTLKGHTEKVTSVAWSPDGKRLATAGDTTAKVWDAASGQELLTLKGPTEKVTSVAWSPDGKRLATAGDTTAKVWDAASGQEVLTMKGHTEKVTSVAWSPDGKRLATASWDRTAKVWDAASGQELLTLKGHTEKVTSVAWSPDGKRLATAGDTTAKVWDAASGQEVLTMKGHNYHVWSVAWSPDGKRLATGSGEYFEGPESVQILGTVKVWDAASGQELLTLNTGYVSSVVWCPDGKRLATGNSGNGEYFYDAGGMQILGTVKVWDAASGQELLTLKGHTKDVSSVAWSADGKLLAMGSSEGKYPKITGVAQVWDVASGQDLLILRGQNEPVWSVTWSPDGKRLATGSVDHTAKVWDTASGQELLTLKGHAGLVRSVAWSPDGKWLATGSVDHTAKVWDAVSGQELLTLKGHTSNVESVAWSPDGKRLATASWDGTTKVWDAASGQELLTLKRHTSNVESVAWSPDGKRLATGNGDHMARVFDPASGQELLTLKGHTKEVWSVFWSPDGKRLATASADKTAKVFDVASGQELPTLTGHIKEVSSVAWSPDGKRLATGSYDNTAKVWDATSGQELLTLEGHTKEVSSVAWSLDGKQLATASSDGTVQIYAMDPHLLLDLARSLVARDLTPDECLRYFQSETCPTLP